MAVVASLVAAAALFSQPPGKLVVKTPAYRVVLSAANGRILEVDDRRGKKLLGGAYGCLWWANPDHHATSATGCSIRPAARWRGSTLTLTYGAKATVTLQALTSLWGCLAEGIPVHGYMHWSLLDNFEWTAGFGKRFGLVALDLKTFQRTPKPSAYHIGRIAQSNRI